MGHLVLCRLNYIYRFDWPITVLTHDAINLRERFRNVDVIPQSTDPRKVSCRVKKGGNTTLVSFKLIFFFIFRLILKLRFNGVFIFIVSVKFIPNFYLIGDD